MAVIFDWIWRFLFTLYKNEYNGIFEVADYDSEIENEEFKIAGGFNMVAIFD